MSYSSTHTKFWPGMSLNATLEASWSKVILDTLEGKKEWAEKEWASLALMNEGK